MKKRDVQSLILGSRGAIGRHLKEELLHRSESGHIFGVDIAVSYDGETGEVLEAPTMDDLGTNLLEDIDMVVGVIGRSIFQDKHIEAILPRGRQKVLVFVSGSTKEDPLKDKIIYLLGELMPINFLYYGIPREIVDEVMAQLFTVSCGLVRRQRSADTLPPRLLALDREIDTDANPLPFAV